MRLILRCSLLVFCSVLMTQAQTITNVSPSSGVVGTQITITGTGLYYDDYGNGSMTLYVGGQRAAVSSWTDTQIIATIPAGLPGYATTVPIYANYTDGVFYDFNSNSFSWTILQAVISSMSPTVGFPGTVVTLNGSGFGTSQDTSTITFCGTAVIPTLWTDNQIRAAVPSGCNQGQFIVTVTGTSPSGSPWFASYPYIASISPDSGTVGTQITISGQAFTQNVWGDAVGVYIGGRWATITSVSDTQIVATIPSGISGTVPIRVNLDDGVFYDIDSNSYSWTILPMVVTLISPTTGGSGTLVTLTGSGFGASQGVSTVTFNGTLAEPTSWSDTQITVPVPSGATSGLVNVVVNNFSSTGLNFTVLQPPSIAAVQPNSGSVGTPVTITGTQFGATQGSSTVTFNGSIAPITSWADDRIVVSVPPDATSGTVLVSNSSGNSNGVGFTVPAPSLSSLYPLSGGVTSTVTLLGSNFGAQQGTVSFGSSASTILSWSNSRIVVSVPTDATTGNVVVNIASGISNGLPFTVLATPHIDSVSQGVPGETVTILGTSLGTQATGSVTFGSSTGSPSSWTDSQITVAVPATFNGGFVTVKSQGVVSNAVYFPVSMRSLAGGGSEGTTGYVTPSEATVLVGEAAEFGMVDSFTDPASDVTWTISDPNIATQETNGDVLRLTAIAPGVVTVTATSGSISATAQLTVVDEEALPEGTARWKLPTGTIQTFINIISAQPAVGSDTAVFLIDRQAGAFNDIVRAFNSYGRQLWTFSSGEIIYGAAATPNGGLVWGTTNGITAVDASGKAWRNPGSDFDEKITVGQDGTIFAPVVGGGTGLGQATYDLLAIDGATGNTKNRISLPIQTSEYYYDPPTEGGGGAKTVVLSDGSAYTVSGSSKRVQKDGTTSEYANTTTCLPDEIGATAFKCDTDSNGHILEYTSEITPINTVDQTLELFGVSSSGSLSKTQLGSYHREQTGFGWIYEYKPDDCAGTPCWRQVGKYSWTEFSETSQGTLGTLDVVPDGQGGLILIGVSGGINGNPVGLRHIPDPGNPTVGTTYTVPLRDVNHLVIGENDTAFADTGNIYDCLPRIIAFNFKTGELKWTYNSQLDQPNCNTEMNIVNAASEGGVWATEGHPAFYAGQYSPQNAFLLDGNGSRVKDVSTQGLGRVTSAGLGMPLWYGQTDAGAATALYSYEALGANSTYRVPEMHSEEATIPIYAYKFTGTAYGNDPAAMVKDGVDFWTSRGLNFAWNGAVTEAGDCWEGTDQGCSPDILTTQEISRAMSRFRHDAGMTLLFARDTPLNAGGAIADVGSADGITATFNFCFESTLGYCWDLQRVLLNFTVFNGHADWVVPHEIGHQLQLRHVSDTANLMCGETGGCTVNNRKLTPEQLRKAIGKSKCMLQPKQFIDYWLCMKD